MGRTGWKSWGKVLVKTAVAGLVVAFAARHVVGTSRDLARRGAMPRVDLAWMGVAVGLYVAGLLAFAAYFARVIRSGPDSVGRWAAIRAYLISHLGKYVPGKAMVVVMRVGLVTPHGARAGPAVFSTLYETLVMMATGGFVAALGLGLSQRSVVGLPVPVGRGETIPVPLPVVGLGLGFAFLLICVPGLFPRIAVALSRKLRGAGHDSMPRFTGRLLAEGMGWAAVGWVFWGLSQVAVIRAVVPGGIAPAAWPVAMGSVALATVAGFAVPVSPGGLGVREWVLWTALAATLDREVAVLAALLLRLAWVAGEVLSAGVAAVVRPAQMPVSVPVGEVAAP